MVVDLVTIGAFFVIATIAILFLGSLLRLSSRRVVRPANHPDVRGDWLANAALRVPMIKADADRLQQELGRAGYYQPSARRDFQVLRYSAAALAVLVAGFAAVVVGPEQQEFVIRIVVIGLILAILCWSVPRLILRSQAQRRVDRIKAALPDALDMIAMCLSGGISLPDAIEHVSREISIAHPELAIELLILRRQSSLSSLEHALREFSTRIGEEEIASMTAIISQGHRLGTDILGAILDFADLMRLKRRQAADTVANKVAVKLLFPLTLCLLPSVLIILWGPAVLELVDFFDTFERPTSIMTNR